MSRIPGRSPQVQRLGLRLKTVELQWLCYSTPSSFPTDHLSGDIGLCVCGCNIMATAPTGSTEMGSKIGGRELVLLSLWDVSLFHLCNQTPENKMLATKIFT